jgi:L-alanine-DL-glutamate epimerase-like enolase superfamily enzyme
MIITNIETFPLRIPVPQRPGLGIDPDPNVIRAYLRQV